ncbi:hypothetical protein [Aquabacterium sp.]|uniref:hypothetical protein n=1 Tax=Aquabacterium sp. TaxID=1872578 RepID=UPI0035ADC120
MSNEAAGAIALIITGLIAALWYWNECIRRVPLEDFGLDNVKRVLRWESDARRQEILVRGWMTSHDWTSMNRNQMAAIDAELKRRGGDQAHESKR